MGDDIVVMETNGGISRTRLVTSSANSVHVYIRKRLNLHLLYESHNSHLFEGLNVVAEKGIPL